MTARARATVLIVDDDLIIQAVMERQLRGCSYRLLFAESVQDALHQLASEQVHLVTVDQHLPDGTGIDLIARIQREHPTVPTVMISGARFKRGLSATPDRFLEKPFQGQTLIQVIEELLGRDPTTPSTRARARTS